MMNFISGLTGLVVAISLFAASPSSTNFNLRNYDFGTGGDSLNSTNYNLNASTGEQSDSSLNSTNYLINPGEKSTQNAFVPVAPTFTNPSSEYNRLKLIINNGTDPSDSKYAVAISSDNFVTTLWVQTDNTVGASYSIVNYQSYSAWGSGTGVWVTGLTSNTTYKVKAMAYQGNFTNSGFGPTATASTVLPTLTFSVETTLTSTPPFNIIFSSITPGVVSTPNADALVGVSTNAMFGGRVFVRDTNSGLLSSLAGFTISSATSDLGIGSLGYGAQVISVSQSSGGPISAVAPYNGASDNVGLLNTLLQPILTTSNAISGGSATIRLKAKSNSTTPSASDFTDSMTLIAAMSF